MNLTPMYKYINHTDVMAESFDSGAWTLRNIALFIGLPCGFILMVFIIARVLLWLEKTESGYR